MVSELSELIAAQMGLHFPQERWRDLERGVGSAAREFGFPDAESCGRWLLSSPLTRSQVETLASHLTVGETYFFRDIKSFEVLEEHVLPELIRSRQGREKRLRIWSAGCATGEEAYSIAILVSKAIPNWKDWQITILGTDINPRSLQRALKGVYSGWSFRGTSQCIRERYFRGNTEGRLEILPHLKEMVMFSYLNLVEDTYPSLVTNTSAMDVIFCRNLLMYFAPEQAWRVIQNFYRSLVDGGWLLVSPTEASQVIDSLFVAVRFPEAIFYQKETDRSQRAGALADRPVEQLRVAFELPLDLLAQPESGVASRAEFGKCSPSEAEPATNASREASPSPEAVAQHAVAFSEDAEATARACANQGQLAAALDWCAKAIAADKLNPGCHYLHATILQEQGSLEEARVSLQRTLYLDPNFVLAHFALGNLALRQRKFREATKHFRNALSLLGAYRQDEILPESEGITAGRLMEIVRSTSPSEASA